MRRLPVNFLDIGLQAGTLPNIGESSAMGRRINAFSRQDVAGRACMMMPKKLVYLHHAARTDAAATLLSGLPRSHVISSLMSNSKSNECMHGLVSRKRLEKSQHTHLV